MQRLFVGVLGGIDVSLFLWDALMVHGTSILPALCAACLHVLKGVHCNSRSFFADLPPFFSHTRMHANQSQVRKMMRLSAHMEVAHAPVHTLTHSHTHSHTPTPRTAGRVHLRAWIMGSAAEDDE